MWKVIQEILPVFLIVLVVSQYVIPIILGTNTWWLFKREKKKIEPVQDPSALSEKIKTARAKADEVKSEAETIKTKVEENLKVAEDLKDEAKKII